MRAPSHKQEYAHLNVCPSGTKDTSRHGILWNGVHLKRGEAVVLNDGDQIRLLGRNAPALEYRSGEHPFTDKKKGEAVLGRYIVHSRILGTCVENTSRIPL